MASYWYGHKVSEAGLGHNEKSKRIGELDIGLIHQNDCGGSTRAGTVGSAYHGGCCGASVDQHGRLWLHHGM